MTNDTLLLITILTIYIIGVVVAYGLAYGTLQNILSVNYDADRRNARLCSIGSWGTVFAIIMTCFVLGNSNRLCFQYRRKGWL